MPACADLFADNAGTQVPGVLHARARRSRDARAQRLFCGRYLGLCRVHRRCRPVTRIGRQSLPGRLGHSRHAATPSPSTSRPHAVTRPQLQGERERPLLTQVLIDRQVGEGVPKDRYERELFMNTLGPGARLWLRLWDPDG